jgi:hypothetical protein
MEQGTAMENRKRALPANQCGARTRSGDECRKSAGWGTPHPGRGRCSLHGGCTPDHVKHAARQEAMEFVVGALGHEMDVDPLEAALMAVRLAAGTVAYWRMSIGSTHDRGIEPTMTQREGYRLSLLDLSRVSRAAIDGGVAEKLVELTGRMAERISLAFEEALQGVQLDFAQRTLIVRRFSQALVQLEGEPIEGEVKWIAA